MSEAAIQTTPPSWFAKINAFFRLPNPRIFILFIISSTATFSLGVAMIAEWILHGQHHPGYHWIVFCAPSMIALPSFLWIICLTFALNFGNKGQILHEPKQSLTQQPLELDQETKVEEVQLEQASTLQDQEAVVQIQPLPNNPSGLTAERGCTGLGLVDEARKSVDDNLTFKRSSSLPLSCTDIDKSSIKRAFSFRL